MLRNTILALVLTAVLLAGCAPTVPTPSGATDYESLLAALAEAGVQAEPAGTIDQDFFSVEGRLIEVGGESVQVFEYSDEESRRADSEVISEDGSSVGTTMITWIDTPHFWAQGELIVLYVGSNTEVVNVLNRVLGDPIAEGAR